ncbi:MAG: urate hydroxylase PuuD [Planctomycetota bacterium]|jgi:uncharacterized membrane protein
MLYLDPAILDVSSLAVAAGSAANPQDSTSGAAWVLFTAAGGEFILRWIHFLAGITWIGVLYYFNFIQTPFFKGGAPKEVVNGMTTGLVPSALWWFRWGAMLTFLSGLSIIMMKGHGGNAFSGPYMTLILTGGLMGTLMWFNVWFIIWPAQKVVIASAKQVAGGGEAIPEAAARAVRAGLASRTNTLFSFPMLFFMGAASHLQELAPVNSLGGYWICALILIGAVEVNALTGPGLTTQKPLGSVTGTIHSGLLVTAILYVLMECFN